MSEPGSSVRIAHADEACAVVVRGALAVGIWPGVPTRARLQTAWGILRAEARERGRPLAVLSVIPDRAPIPALADVPAIAREIEASVSAMIAFCVAFEGHGAWVDRALDMATMLDAGRIALRPAALARRYTTSVEEGATWLAGQLRRAGEEVPTRAEIVETVELARAAVRG